MVACTLAPSLGIAETLLAVAPGRSAATRSEATARPEVPFPRHVIHLDANAVGVLEQEGIVAGSELRLLGWMDDSRPELLGDEAMNRVDVRATPCAEAQVMETRAPLIE